MFRKHDPQSTHPASQQRITNKRVEGPRKTGQNNEYKSEH